MATSQERLFKMIHKSDPTQEFLVRARVDQKGVADLIPLGQKGTIWITDVDALARGGDRFNTYHRLPPYSNGNIDKA